MAQWTNDNETSSSVVLYSGVVAIAAMIAMLVVVLTSICPKYRKKYIPENVMRKRMSTSPATSFSTLATKPEYEYEYQQNFMNNFEAWQRMMNENGPDVSSVGSGGISMNAPSRVNQSAVPSPHSFARSFGPGRMQKPRRQGVH